MPISPECVEFHGNFQLFSGLHLSRLKHPMGQEDLGAGLHTQGKAVLVLTEQQTLIP